MEFTNIGDTDNVRLTFQIIVTIIDGDPNSNRPNIEMNVKNLLQRLVKHIYRKGWNISLQMPV